jgi:hypothetical protein
MVSTCVLNFRCIIRVEHFQKILVLKEGPKHCQYTFYFLINTILFILNFTTMVSTIAAHDHLVKLSGGLLLLEVVW